MASHKRMARPERAKQFMAFSALRGYEEALRRAEEEHSRDWEERGKNPAGDQRVNSDKF